MAEVAASNTRNKARKKVYCNVCRTFISSECVLPQHNSGKKHQRQLERQACAGRSIYVRGFCNVSALESDLRDYFCKFGNVSGVFVDKEKTEYAIVEFDCPTVATTIVASKELPLFHGKQLTIKQRSVNEHTTKKQQSMLPNKVRTMPDVKVSHFLDGHVVDNMKQAKTVEDQVQILVLATCLTEDDDQLRNLIVQYLHEIFVEVFPECEIKLFGSSSTCLGLKGADLDLSLFVDPLSLENQVEEFGEDQSSPNDMTDSLNFIVQLLKKFAAGFQNIVSVPSAKCPLVKFVHRDSGLSCDLSINNRLAIRNTELIKSYVALDDRIRPLAITLKNWGGANHLTGSGGRQVSNYSLVVMLLHFLQRTTPPVVPVLQSTDEDDGQGAVGEMIIDGWDCSFISTRSPTNEDGNKQSFRDLLKAWFYYYGHTFDYANEVITIQHGGRKRVLKHDINENITQISGKDTFKVSPLSVQDPFELSHNLAQGVSVDFLRRFIQSCMDACSFLNSTEISANSSSSNPERFLELFTTPADCTVKPGKKVVHSFAIPLHPIVSNQEGEESETVQLQRTCEFITDILIHDLSVSPELQSDELVPAKLVTEINNDQKSCDYKAFDNTPGCDVQENVSLPSGKRPREEDESTEMVDIKKVKLSGKGAKKGLVLLCKASHITWQNRRRQRRLQKQSDAGTNDSNVDDPQIVGKGLPTALANQGDLQVDEQDSGHDTKKLLQSSQSSSDKTSTSDSIKNIVHDSSSEKPLMAFKLKLELLNNVQTNDNYGCLITLCYVSGPFQHFSNFYAFFKKHVMNKLAKGK